MIILLSIVLIFLSAFFSGLNLGLMSLGVHELKRKAKAGNIDAKRVYSVRKNGNLLLVSLLIGNVAAISALSLVLDTIFVGLVAGILTTALITLFGEIIPQALFSRYALSLGAQLVWLVRIVIVLLWPIAAPIAFVLDKALGDELPTVYAKSELAQLLEEHAKHEGSDIDQDEVRIATGALSFGDMTIKQIMTPAKIVNTIGASEVIDEAKINKIKASGNSRFPIIGKKPNQIVGLLYAKDLINLNSYDHTAKELARKNVRQVKQNTKLDDILNLFIKDRQHLFIVVDRSQKFKGIVTLEDVIEEILREEIVDEYDTFEEAS